MQFNLWSMIGLGEGGREWTLDEKLDRIRDAGYSGFEASPRSIDEAEDLAGRLVARGLEVGLAAIIREPDELPPVLDMARRMEAGYVSLQVLGALMTAPMIVRRLKKMYRLANSAGLPLFIETHRGRVTQDLLRTLKMIDRLDRLRFTGDFSHYVVAGEMGGEWNEETWRAFERIAKRCGNWHGRIGNGEQVQNDVGDGRGAQAQRFKRLWSMGMAHWLAAARPGDVLPFCVELGPPPYSIQDLDGREISDRWAQAAVIRRLAEEAWAEAGGRPGR